MHRTLTNAMCILIRGVSYNSSPVNVRYQRAANCIYTLSVRLVLQDFEKMEKLACDGLSTLTGNLAGTYYPLRGMDKATQEKMIEDHFLFRADDEYVTFSPSLHIYVRFPSLCTKTMILHDL